MSRPISLSGKIKILSHLLFLSRLKSGNFNITDSPLCAFVKHESHPLSIFFIITKFQNVSGIYSLPTLNKLNLRTLPLTLENDMVWIIILKRSDFEASVIFFLLGNFFIYKCMLKLKDPFVGVFLVKIKITFNTKLRKQSN